MPKPQELLSAAQEISSELVALRRLLHENPEFALNLPGAPRGFGGNLARQSSYVYRTCNQRWQARANSFATGRHGCPACN